MRTTTETVYAKYELKTVYTLECYLMLESNPFVSRCTDEEGEMPADGVQMKWRYYTNEYRKGTFLRAFSPDAVGGQPVCFSMMFFCAIAEKSIHSISTIGASEQ